LLKQGYLFEGGPFCVGIEVSQRRPHLGLVIKLVAERPRSVSAGLLKKFV